MMPHVVVCVFRKVSNKLCHSRSERCEAKFLEAKLSRSKCTLFVSISCRNIEVRIVRNNTGICRYRGISYITALAGMHQLIFKYATTKIIIK